MTIDTMTVKDLRLLREKINAKIEIKQADARHNLKVKLAVLAESRGYTLAEIIDAKPAKVKRGKRQRDPSTGVVWSGWGRMPNNFDRKRAVPA